jgi:peptidoglycan/LPS O-acetylase OafA/YrhL
MARAASQRGIGLVVLLVLGILSLPVVATFLDGQSTENWIIPVQLVLMALVGALVGYLLPGLAGPDSSSQRGAGAGAVVGVVAAVLGVLLFFVLLDGF